MRISYLEEFIVLASYSKLTTAARALHMSHSALSQHLAALEKELGCELFSRNGGFELASEGEVALEHAQKVVFEYNELLHSCSVFDESVVRLRTSDYEICNPVLERAREPFLERHPEMRVVITSDAYQRPDPIDLLVEGDRDVAILLVVRGSGQHAEDMVPDDVRWMRDGAYRLVFAVKDDHPCAGKSVLSAEDLDGATVVSSLCPSSILLMDGVSRFLEAHGVRIRPSFKQVSDNADALYGDLGNRFALLYEPLGGFLEELEVPAAPGRFEEDVIADAYILYRPESLSEFQLEYLELARELNHPAAPS
ncbi:LysR family transcriptional regulator [Adlercreutzia shanghongiae]|uniref:LysR family transcriptional regulator n=1 Tax=Adlercreutzia shanghongiae TaxID=3111773 RepID=A0ABU6J0V9_9ACTN|nr:LysR family transcriptional regulator [Adlercreutzia sp. R22]MEC4295404.1 LysR family transcriptional regulator [Adlercreutzia sp. R22]